MKQIIKSAVLLVSILFLSCSKNPLDSNYTSVSHTNTNGLGQLVKFKGQEDGEMFTTQAPHNQVFLFAYDDSSFNPKYNAALNAQAIFLSSHPHAKILLAGHTDERGSREYNIALGERRAKTVAELLRMAHVSLQQIRIVSYGKERLINFEHTEASHAQNRRVEFIYEVTR